MPDKKNIAIEGGKLQRAWGGYCNSIGSDARERQRSAV